MTETTQEVPTPKTGDMLRITAENLSQLLTQMADHVDNLEDTIVKLQLRITELETPTTTSQE